MGYSPSARFPEINPIMEHEGGILRDESENYARARESMGPGLSARHINEQFHRASETGSTGKRAFKSNFERSNITALPQARSAPATVAHLN